MTARDGREVRIPHFDIHGSREEMLAREPRRHVTRHARDFAADRDDVDEILGVGVFAAARLGRAVRHDGPIVDPVRERSQPLGLTADRRAQDLDVDAPHIGELLDPAGAQLAGSDRTDAPQRVDRELQQKVFHSFGRDHRQTVRLSPA
jgi:hypothetical protein